MGRGARERDGCVKGTTGAWGHHGHVPSRAPTCPLVPSRALSPPYGTQVTLAPPSSVVRVCPLLGLPAGWVMVRMSDASPVVVSCART